MLIIPSSWGSLRGVIYTPSSNFSGAVTGEKEDFCKGSLLRSIFYFVICFALFYFCLHCFIKNTKKISSFDSLHSVTFTFKIIMLFLKYALEDLSVGSGFIIGKGNIEELFNHVSMHKNVEDISLAELAPSYEVASSYLVHILEARFVNLNPFMQQMFLKLHDIEDSQKKDFILETLRREFRDIVIEARKVF
jgi:hypothetical protein